MANVTNDGHRELPDTQTITAAGNLSVQDENGKEVLFNTLYQSQSKILIIFIRNFFCGYCEQYLRSLIAHLPPASSVTIIGCGSPDLIPDYRTRNSIPYPIYADPSLALYNKLGFNCSSQPLADGWKARVSPYHNQGFVSMTLSGIWHGLSLGPKKAFGNGPAGQNGGAVLFEGGEVKFMHRMRDVGDYLSPEEAAVVLGVGSESSVKS